MTEGVRETLSPRSPKAAAALPIAQPDRGQPDITASVSSHAETSAAAGPTLRAALEALLLVVEEPVTPDLLAAAVGESVEVVTAALTDLAEEYDEAGRGFELRAVAGGWRFYTRAVCSPVIERFLLEGQPARLSQAALETLAVIAYRQPVTRARVAAVRGVNVDGVVRTLLSRGLITEAGSEADSGAVLLATSALFLERLGLRSLTELPSLAPLLPELDDMEDR